VHLWVPCLQEGKTFSSQADQGRLAFCRRHFMTGDHGVVRVPPLVPRLVDVAVTDATVLNVHEHVV
jgi:hypothetical protein